MGGQGKTTVLVVDDEPGVLAAIVKMLDKERHTVFAAGDGEEALRVIQEQDGHVDLVLTDVLMSPMSGLELAAELSESYSAIKVLYISGAKNTEHIDYALRQGVGHGSIQKPFDHRQLVEKIVEVLGG